MAAPGAGMVSGAAAGSMHSARVPEVPTGQTLHCIARVHAAIFVSRGPHGERSMRASCCLEV